MNHAENYAGAYKLICPFLVFSSQKIRFLVQNCNQADIIIVFQNLTDILIFYLQLCFQILIIF
jgi:hypothetical protein